MSISDPFIRRPVMTTLVMLGILVFGILGYRKLPVSDLPNVDFPTLQVSASVPGATPETMAAAVATPLERQFSTIAGVTNMTSTSTQGTTSITLQFDLSRELDAAAQDVQSAIAAASRQLPPDMPSPPSYRKVNPADQPILYLVLTSATLPLNRLDEYAETFLAQSISTVSGVAQVMVFGAQKYAVRIQVDPRALASRGIGIDGVEAAVRDANVNLPTGTLSGLHRTYQIQANGQLSDATAFGDLIVMDHDGQPVRLRELGRVVDSVENNKTAAWYGDQRAIILAVQRQPGSNTVLVARSVRALLPRFESQLPAAVALHVLFDRSESIQASVKDVKTTLLIALVLVVLVIFLFLRNLSATLIPSMALPMSIVGTFALMYWLGYSLDNLSLLALTLCVGFVVDDAIVVLENIVRHREMGESVVDAARNGAQEIGFTIVSMTLSLSAVFIPVLFMGGILGRLFHEFAVTIALAVLISGIVSLTLTPMLASRILESRRQEGSGRFHGISERAFERLRAAYDRGLGWSLRHGGLTLLYSGATLALIFLLFVRLPKGFLPSEDTGQLSVTTEGLEGISFESMVEHQKMVAAVLQQDPNIDALMSSVAARGASGYQGSAFIRLRPRSKRRLGPDQIIAELRPKLARIPGVRTYLQNPPPIRVGGLQSQAQYQFTLQSIDTHTLFQVSDQFLERMRGLPGLQDVASDLHLNSPQVRIIIDRDKATALGLSAQQIEGALQGAFASGEVTTIDTASNEYSVILEVLPEFQRDPAVLSMLFIRSSSGDVVPLDTVAHIMTSTGPVSVNHLGQLPAVTISFNLQPGYALGSAVSEVQRLAREMLPATVNTTFQGTAQAFQSSLRGLGLLLVLAVLVIYLVLGILYESFLHPLTILTALPFAALGALLTLLVFHVQLSVYGFVGIVMLIGIVKKNGIMMIDFALEAQRREGKDALRAIHDACLVRFRPIMMTTVAALAGTLPIALGFGAGSESRRPLGLAVVGGLLFSQSLTLFVTPVFFIYMDRLQTRLAHWRVHKPAAAATVHDVA